MRCISWHGLGLTGMGVKAGFSDAFVVFWRAYLHCWRGTFVVLWSWMHGGEEGFFTDD